MFQFTDDCLIGIHALDDDHRYLFELINRVMELLKEEEYMEQIRDPELLKQRAQHDF